jgi:hypothetical protein
MESGGRGMKLKLDENLSRHLKHTLAALDHDVTTAADQGLLSLSDTLIAEVVKNEWEGISI